MMAPFGDGFVVFILLRSCGTGSSFSWREWSLQRCYMERWNI